MNLRTCRPRTTSGCGERDLAVGLSGRSILGTVGGLPTCAPARAREKANTIIYTHKLRGRKLGGDTWRHRKRGGNPPWQHVAPTVAENRERRQENHLLLA